MLRARLEGGIRGKAARGHLRRGLPAGLVRGEADGQIGFRPDEAVTGVIGAVSGQFAVCGPVRGVWLWLRDQGLRWPLQGACRRGQDAGITWVAPACHAVHTTLTNPAYAGAYAYGRPAPDATLTPAGCCAAGAVRCPAASGRYLSPATTKDGSPGRPTWPASSASPATPGRRPASRAPARCGKAALSCRAWPAAGSAAAGSPCPATGRPDPPPATFAPGQVPVPVGARGTRHLRVGGSAIDAAVTGVFLAALAPAALQACLAAAQQLEDGYDTALDQWRRQLEQARYAATRAERRYRPVDPENRLAARGLETEGETALGQPAGAGAVSRPGPRP